MMDPYRESSKNQVHTASPAERLLIAVPNDLTYLSKQSRRGICKGDMKEFNNQILYAQRVL